MKHAISILERQEEAASKNAKLEYVTDQRNLDLAVARSCREAINVLEECDNPAELRAVSPTEDLRVILDAVVRLTELRQSGCNHLCVDNFAAECLTKLIQALKVTDEK